MSDYPNGYVSPYGPSDTWPEPGVWVVGDDVVHLPMIKPSMKMDGGPGWAPACSCGWTGTSWWTSPQSALRAAEMHATAKSGERRG